MYPLHYLWPRHHQNKAAMRTSRQDWFGLGLPRVHFGQVWASLSLLLVGWGGVGWWGVGWDGGGMGGMVHEWGMEGWVGGWDGGMV